MFYKALLMLILAVTSLLANENASEYALKHQEISSAVSSVVIQIVTEQSDSIQYFEEDRLYLKAERIFPINNGLLLCNGQSSIILPALFTDQTGYYLPCARRYLMQCVNSNCGYCCWDAYEDGVACPACGAGGDPV